MRIPTCRYLLFPTLLATLAGVLVCVSGARGADTYDGARLSAPAVRIGTALYSNLVVTPADIIGVGQGAAVGSEDSYDPVTARLTIPTVAYGGRTYTNVLITVGSLVSVGAVGGVDTYDGTYLHIPTVQVAGGATYANVTIVVGDIVSRGGGMPAHARDVYDPATRRLTIAAIELGGTVYTNAIVTLGRLVSVGGIVTAGGVPRPLPPAYRGAQAVNYGPYGPGEAPLQALPTVAEIDRQLQLLQAAGFTLMRLFGSDAVSGMILDEAAAKYPGLSFHLGIYVQGPAVPPDCDVAANNTQIYAGIALANTHANVVAVSVGNETSLSPPGPLPVTCLARYLTTVRSAVAQPVTTDDTGSFFAGLAELPDPLFPLIDFVSAHIYPFSGFAAQYAVSAPPLNPAYAEMTGALAAAQDQYAQIVGYLQARGSALPVVVGETGWKARRAGGSSLPEQCCASPVNQKWYADEMRAWGGSPGGPASVFVFEAFDEPWKGTDDGWGLWDQFLTPRYALCGTGVPGAPTCASPDPYVGACYEGAAGCPVGAPLTFAGGFMSASVTVERGSWGGYSGGFPAGASLIAGGGFTDSSPPLTAASSYVFYGLQAAAPPTGGAYAALFVDAPGYVTGVSNTTTGVTLSGQTTLTLNVGLNTEWFAQGMHRSIAVVLVGGTVYRNGMASCQTALTGSIAPSGVGPAAYAVPLDSLALTQGCNGSGFASGITTVAQALSLPIVQVGVQAVYPDVNTTVRTAAGTYATVLSLSGSLVFQ